MLACFKVKVLLDCFMLCGSSNGCESSVLFQQLLEPALYKNTSGKPHLPHSWMRIKLGLRASHSFIFCIQLLRGREALQGNMLGIARAEFGTLELGSGPAGTFLENAVGVALSCLLCCWFPLLLVKQCI